MIEHNYETGEPGTRAAYRKGCRCDQCKEANTSAQRAQRARRTAQYRDGDGQAAADDWEAWDGVQAEPDEPAVSELTNQQCGNCGALLEWAGARAGLACPECGNTEPSPEAQNRAAGYTESQERSIAIKAEHAERSNQPSMPEKYEFSKQKIYTLDELRKLDDQLNEYESYSDFAWYSVVVNSRRVLKSIITLTEHAQNASELEEAGNTVRSDLLGITGQMHSLTYNYRNFLSNTREINNPPRLAITADEYTGSEPVEEIEYDDDNEEYDNSFRYHDGEPSNLLAGLLIMGVAIVVLCAVLVKYNLYMDTEIPITCDLRHIKGKMLATRYLAPDNYTKPDNFICEKHFGKADKIAEKIGFADGYVYSESFPEGWTETRRERKNRKSPDRPDTIPGNQ